MYKSLKTAFHDKFLLCGKAVWKIQTDLRISDIIPTSTKQILLHIWWLMWCTLGFMTQCSVAWLAESAPLSYGSCMDQGMWFLSFWALWMRHPVETAKPRPGFIGTSSRKGIVWGPWRNQEYIALFLIRKKLANSAVEQDTYLEMGDHSRLLWFSYFLRCLFLLHWDYLWFRGAGAALGCRGRASHCMASLAVEHSLQAPRLRSCSSLALERGLRARGTRV